MKSRKPAKVSRKSQRADRHRKALRGSLRSFETLEERRLLTVAPWSDGFYYPPIGVSTAFLPNGLSYQEYAAISSQQYGTNGGGGSGFLHGEGAGNFANLTEVEPNDVLTQATPINLGTGAGQNDGVAIVGNLALPSVPGAGPDQDYYVFDLKAGDIFDAHVLGLAAQTFDLAILDSQRREIIGNRGSASGNYPIPDSPLTQTTGNADLAFVVPADGRYYARLSDGDSVYTLTLRVRRPVLESQPVGTKQKIFLDFDGEYLRNEIFGGPGGTARLSPLVDTLPNWGLTAADESRIIDRVVDVFRSKFFGATAVSGVGGNGHYGTSGIAGQFDIEILNSRDHADPWGQPNVSRIIIGGTALELGINTVGIAQSIDIGNFDTTETAVVLADTILANFGGVPRAGNLSLEDVMVDSTALVAVHEAGHFLGGWHTLNTNNNPQIMDTGGTPANLLGVGLDGIYGTADDRDVQFGTDTYDPTASGIEFGRQNSAAAMAWGLSTGKVGGGTIRGNVYVDRNLSRTRDAGDAPLAGAVIYVDMNNDGIHQVGELTSVADAAGNYQLSVPPGTYVIREIAPAGYRVALPQGNGYQLTVAANQTIANRDFANDLLDMTVTGRKFNDINGNGIIDAGEPGIENVWIYVDLDGDQRIDIGEPAAKTKADGTYKLTFPPQAGVYKLREVIESGYTQTVPGAALNHEYTVTLTGNPAVDNLAIAGLHFGNQLAAADYGDAPATYGAAFHSFREGLILGAQWDAEAANQPSADAKGDDNNGVDDEDGIGISQPLVEGGENSISVTAVNTTGQVAYLQGWIDLNNDGDFADAGERLITNAVVGTQPVTAVTFTLPAGVAGDRFARFRYSLSRDTGPTGPATSGEVEDYVLTILPASQGNLAVDDVAGPFTQGSVLNEIDVLANDFKSPGETLELVSISEPTSGGRVVISSSNTLLYTPPSRFLGTDTFTYTMRNAAGNLFTANVSVEVRLFFPDAIAVDDSFDVSTNVLDIPLNVLANDIEGSDGALSILSVTQPDRGGSVSIATGAQSLRYTPSRDFGGTESFTYTVTDVGGGLSTAQVTVHTLPGDRADDRIQIRLEATNLAGTPIASIPQGESFKINVLLDDLRFDSTNPGLAAGVFAAYTDLLYNLQLVSPAAPTGTSGNLDFAVEFFNSYNNGRTGSASVPGLINELGAFFQGDTMDRPNETRLAALTFQAISPGIAKFLADPSDVRPDSDSLLFDTVNVPVPTSQIRYLGTSLEIVGDGAQFPLAVDDSLPQAISVNAVNVPINVLANDKVGSSGPLSIKSVGGAMHGTTTINAGSVLYTPNRDFIGADQFTYTVQDSRGIASTATVTLRVGAASADDDIAELRLSVTDTNGQSIDQIAVGSQFQLRGYVNDLRTSGANRGIFAAYQDVLYSSNLVSPVVSSTNPLGFEVRFGETPSTADYSRIIEGDIRTAGVINEIGAVSTLDQPLGSGEKLMFIVTMTANAAGTARFTGDPADISPLHDTLTYDPVQPVGFDRVRYGFDSLVIGGSFNGGGEGEGFTNLSNPFDVNADGYVSPIDVLSVINSLNNGGARPLFGGTAGGEGEASSARLYIDTNGDGFLSPIDVLSVINYLNSRLGGEGESQTAAAITQAAPMVENDKTASELLPDDLAPALAETLLSQTPAAAPTTADGAADGDRDEQLLAATDELFDSSEDAIDELLSQLATEIDKRWKLGQV